jgi:PTH2 family peptidyl-tRNA hydrolase
MTSKYKLAIVMRTDLEMGRGKQCVQAGHASILAFRNQFKYEGEASSALYTISQGAREWLEEGQFKVVLKTKSLQELIMLEAKARDMDLPVISVQDYGLTQVAPMTTTCIAIGPALCSEVDKVTGGLSLL